MIVKCARPECPNTFEKKPNSPKFFCDSSCARKVRNSTYRKNREIALWLSDGKCIICEDEATEVHHAIPLSWGGTNEIDNLEPMCHTCHVERHRELRKYYAETQANIGATREGEALDYAVTAVA